MGTVLQQKIIITAKTLCFQKTRLNIEDPENFLEIILIPGILIFANTVRDPGMETLAPQVAPQLFT